MTIDELRRFLDKVRPQGRHLIWTAGTCGGTPRFAYRGRNAIAARVIYEHHNGELKPGQDVTASCGDKLCVSPSCLIAVSKPDRAKLWHDKLVEAARRFGRMKTPAQTRARRRNVRVAIAARVERNKHAVG